MSNELIAILGVGIALAVMMNTQIRSLRADLVQRFDYKIDALDKRLDDQAIEMGATKTEMGAIKKEMGAMRKDIHALGERMAHLEGLVEGLKEAVVARFAA